MKENTKYWIWLSQALGTAARVDEILAAFPDPKKLYEADAAERMISGVFTRRQLEKLGEAKLEDAETAIALCEKNGWQAVTPADSAYPAGLRRLTDMPLVLYVDGDIGCVSGKVIIGVVGTRKPCFESTAVARRISSELAAAGAVVVSGGALGIDSSAHEGALAAGGKTVCVMGCGFGTNYLMDNEALRRSVKESGALITEYPPFFRASKTTFPERNRIISGMSHGILVVEAGEKSGSLITARRANEQGREVFAIPGSVLSSAYTGTNNLIRDGAKAVTCTKDILSVFAAMYPDRIDIKAVEQAAELPREENKKVRVKKEAGDGLGADAAAVYAIFENDALHPDEICAASGLPLPRVISALMQLEIAGLIEQTDGKNYAVCS